MTMLQLYFFCNSLVRLGKIRNFDRKIALIIWVMFFLTKSLYKLTRLAKLSSIYSNRQGFRVLLVFYYQQ